MNQYINKSHEVAMSPTLLSAVAKACRVDFAIGDS